MKKVKLLGVLAASTMILAGCAGGNTSTSTEPTSTEPTSTEPAPEVDEWSEADAGIIKDVLSFKSSGQGISYKGKLPHAGNLAVKSYPQEGNDETYLLAVGDKATEAQVSAYAAQLESDKYGFEEMEEVPEDITFAEDFEEGSVLAYFKNLSGDHFFPTYGVSVVVGLQEDTEKLQLCATLTMCGWNEHDVYGTSILSYKYTDETIPQLDQTYRELFRQYTQEYAIGYMFDINGLPTITDDMTDDQYKAAVAAASENFVFETSTAATSIAIVDSQYVSPFSTGNLYSDEKDVHSSFEYYYLDMSETEYDTFVAGLTAKSYVKGSGDVYSLEVADLGTFYVGVKFYPAGEFMDEKSVVQTYYDYKAPTTAA